MASRGRSSNSGRGHSGGGHSGGGSHGNFGHGGFRITPHHHGSSTTDFLMSAFIAKKLFGEEGGSGQSNDGPTVSKYIRSKDKTKTNIVSIILFGLAVLFLFLSIFSVEISYGKVVGTVESWDDHYEYGTRYYFTRYNYVVDGQEYSAESLSGWEDPPENETTYIGSKAELYYKRTNPYEIYEVEDKANIPTFLALFEFFTFAFLIAGICVRVNGVGKYQENPEWKRQVEEIKEKQELGGKSRCSYCGTIVEEGKTRCPSCGASIK